MTAAEPENWDAMIAQARQGDEAAMEQLLSAHTERLLTSVRAELGAKLRQRLESQDVMQQVYLDALTNINNFVDQGHDSFFRWLRRIAVNRIVDADRRAFKTIKRGAEKRVADVIQNDASMMNLLDVLPVSQCGPVTQADRADRIDLIRDALQRLAADQREALSYRYLHQLSVEETARKMNKTDRAVRSLCVRALIRLRELLGDAV